MDSRRSRGRTRAVVPPKVRANLQPLQVTTDDQGRPMIARDVLDRAVFQNGIISPASSKSSTRSTPITLRVQQPRYPSPRRPVIKARILRPPPEVPEDRTTPEPQYSKQRFWQRIDASNDPQYDSDSRSSDQPGPSSNHFSRNGSIVQGRNDFRNMSRNVSTRNGHEFFGQLHNSSSRSVVSRANVMHNQGGEIRNHAVALRANNNNGVNRNNNNNNNNGVNRNNNNSVNRNNNNNNNNNSSSSSSSLGAHLGGVRNMQNPIFVTVVNPDPSSVKSPGVTLKRPRPSTEPEPELVQPKKARVMEFTTAQCFLCPSCSFFDLSKETLTKHLKAVHPEMYADMTVDWEFDVDGSVECGDCRVKFFTKQELKQHMQESHGTNRFVIQAFPAAPDENSPITGEHGLFNVSESEIDEDDVEDHEVLEDFSSDSPVARDEDTPSPDFGYDMDMNPASNAVTADSGLDIASDVPSVEDLGPVGCSFSGCDVILNGESNMEYHKTCHQNAGFMCPQCQHEEDAWLPLALHMWRSHGIDMDLIQCDHCDYRHTTKNGMNAHLSKHGVEKVCETCNRKFKGDKNYNNHVRACRAQMVSPLPDDPIVTYSAKVFKCTECPSTFRSKKQMKKHQETVHRKTFSCDVCDFVGSDATALAVHKRTHTGENSLECIECGYRTDDPSNLRSHVNAHPKDSVHTCPLCSIGCSDAEELKNHATAAHPDARDEIVLACSICGKEFIFQSSLNSHMTSCHPNAFPEITGESDESITTDNSQEALENTSDDAFPIVSVGDVTMDFNIVGSTGFPSFPLGNGITYTYPQPLHTLSHARVDENASVPMIELQASEFQPNTAPSEDDSFSAFFQTDPFHDGSVGSELFHELDRLDSNANATKPPDMSQNQLSFL